MSGYINVRSEFDKELKLPSANDCYSHAQASVHYSRYNTQVSDSH